MRIERSQKPTSASTFSHDNKQKRLRYSVSLSLACTDRILSTFLKRKGGLFKKAHELSVLCSVDVAVIIFGHNKKLYEYSSGDIQETIGRYQYVSTDGENTGL